MAFQEFTPIQYLKIDIAGSYGLDKESWDDRIAWFDQNEDQLLQLAAIEDQKVLKANAFIKEADAPALLYAGALAYARAKRGEAISHAVSLDATASGAQLLALLMGCEKSASHCNVIDSGKREDLYTNAYQLMLQYMGANSGGITRGQVKDAVMPGFYGSKAMPKEIFGEGEQLRIFYEVMETEFPGIWDLIQALLNLWQPDVDAHCWVLPDNFRVLIKVMDEREETVQFLNMPMTVKTKVNRPMEEGRSLVANITHSIDGMVVKEMSRRCSYDLDKVLELMELLTTEIAYRPLLNRPKDQLVQTLWDHYQRTGFLSARIIELLDADNLLLVDREVIRKMLLSMPEKPFPIMSVHDCFRCHPNYGNDLRRQYNQILHDLSASTLLYDIVNQISPRHIPVVKYQDFTSKVLEANYALS